MSIGRSPELRDRVVHGIKTLIALFIVHTGILRLFLRLIRPRIFVLAYHRVAARDSLDPCAFPSMYVSEATFERQLLALRQLFRTVPVSELRGVFDGTRRLRENVAVVTFDGGYRDNYERALPILTRQRLAATFFLSLGFVDERRTFWFDRLGDALRAWDASPADRRSMRTVMPAPLLAAFESAAPTSERLDRAAQFLAALPLEDRRAAMKHLAPEFVPPTDASRAQPLRWHQVRRLREAGMEVGGYGVSHSDLTRMLADEVQEEIMTSLQRVGARIGERVTAFAYPHGAADPEVARVAHAAGAELGFTRRPHPNRVDADPLLLGRFTISERSSRSLLSSFSRAYFWCEITGVFAFLSRLGRPWRSRKRAPAAPALRWTGPQESLPPRRLRPREYARVDPC